MADENSAITTDQPVIDAPQPEPVPSTPEETHQEEPAKPAPQSETPVSEFPPEPSQISDIKPQVSEPPTTPSPQPTPAPEPSPPATPPTAQDPVQAPPPEPLATPTSEPTKVSDMPPAPIPEPSQVSDIKPQVSDAEIVSSLTDDQLKAAASLYAKKNQKVLSRKGVEARQAVAQKNVADIVAFVASHSPANNRKIARALNLPPRRVQHYMQQLTHDGSVTASGWGISREYRIKK